jgi:hypothetical protein
MPRDPEKRFRKLTKRPHLRKLAREQIAALFPSGASAEIAFVDNIPDVGASKILPMGNPTDGQNYQDCSHLPLFGPNSPNLHDILQGWTPDCYAIVCFGGMALCDPESVRNQVRRVGNKFYSRFTYNGEDTWVEQDGLLPTGQGLRWIDDIWAPIYEKAYAYWRTRLTTKQNTYASLGWGNPANGPLAALGWSCVGYTPSASAFGLAATAILENRPCFVLTKPAVAAGVPLLGSHAYNLTGVNADSTLTAYNPHGRDGAGLDSNPEDGMVTFTQAQGLANLSYLVIGTRHHPPAPFPLVTPAPAPIPGDANGDGIVSFADFTTVANNFGKSGATWAMGDFNGNGTVDFADYVTLSNNFGKTSTGAVIPATPEERAAMQAFADKHSDPPENTMRAQAAFSVSRMNAKHWDRIDFAWNTSNAAKVTLNGAPVALNGSDSMPMPNHDLTLTLVATGLDGIPVQRIVLVTLTTDAPAPTPLPTPLPTPTPSSPIKLALTLNADGTVGGTWGKA